MMKIPLIILGLYLLYFAGMILYDLFLNKPKANANSDDTPVIIMEGQEDLHEQISATVSQTTEEDFAIRNVSLENVEVFDTKEFLDDDEIIEQSRDEQEISINAKAKMEQEAYADLENEDDTENDDRFNEISVKDFDSVEKSEYPFLAQYQKIAFDKNSQVQSVEEIIDDEDVFEMLQEPDRITSFEYSNMRYVS